MNEKRYVGRRISSVELYDEIGPITGVALLLDDNNEILSGSEDGYVLEVDCKYGTQAMADNILASVVGQTYKGFRANGAVLDPAAELGDGITVDGTYSLLAYRNVNFGPGHMSEIAAPGENTLEHEYDYKTPTERANRKIAGAYSLISKTASEIRLEVSVENQKTAASIEALEKQFGEDLSDLSGNITETLKSYSTITQTSESITSAVSECKTYTDNETGKVIAELEAYSTIEQTADKISSAVSESKSYTDTKTGEVVTLLESYSTIEQTADKISLAVNGLINGDQAQALIDQSLEGIELSVSNGSTSSTISLKAGETVIDSASISFSGFVTYSGLSGGTTTIDGACIKTGTIAAERLNLSGAISFNDFDDDTQEYISGLGSDITLPDYIKSTYIDETEIRSPTIIGGTIYAANENAYTVMTSYGLQMFVNDVSKPKIELVNYSNLIQLNLGAGVSTGDNIYGTFGLQKTTTNAGCYYWSGTNYGTMCGFTFNNDGTITVHGTLVDTNGNALIGG